MRHARTVESSPLTQQLQVQAADKNWRLRFTARSLNSSSHYPQTAYLTYPSLPLKNHPPYQLTIASGLLHTGRNICYFVRR